MPEDVPVKRKPKGFFYRLSRKIRYLNYRGTLFHKTPREYRHKKTLVKRRNFRHRFAFLRFRVMHRVNRLAYYKAEKIKAGPTGYERFAGRKPAVVQKPARKKLSLRERYRRFRRIRHYLKNKRKQRKEHLRTIRRKKKRRPLRVLFYLIRKGKFFRINFRGFGNFLHRKYSFLGKSTYAIIIVNSTAYYLIAYTLIYIAKGLATALVSNAYQIRTIISYYGINFLIRTGDWTPDKVEVVFSAGAFMSFLIFIVSAVIYAKTIHETWNFRLFLLWLTILSFIQIFGETMMGSLLMEGFGWVIAYIFLLDTPKLIISLVGFICLVSAGLISSRSLLYSGNMYFNSVDKNNRMPFMMSQVFLPLIIGSGIIYFMKYPVISQLETGVLISAIFFVLPAIIRAKFSSTMYFDEEPKKIRLLWPWILAAMILLPMFRIIFGIGVRL
jgi:hypothetical protein